MQQKRKPAIQQRKGKEEVNKKLIIGIGAGVALVIVIMTVLLILQG